MRKAKNNSPKRITAGIHSVGKEEEITPRMS